MLPNILKETVRGIQPILIEDEMLQHREVFLIEEVNRKSATDMIKQLMYLDRIDTGKPVTVYINSPGGEVVSGLAVFLQNILKLKIIVETMTLLMHVIYGMA